MSVRLNGATDLLSTTQALTIGTSAFSFGLWVNVQSAPGNKRLVMVLADQVSPTVAMPITLDNGTGNQIWAELSDSSAMSPASAYSTATWYWVVYSRNSPAAYTYNLRIFTEANVTGGTGPTWSDTQSDSVNFTTIDTIGIGDMGFANGAADMEVANAKVHTGVEWTAAQCRTEGALFGIQTAGGTNRYCWELEDVDADVHGLYERAGSGPNFTNSGAIAGSTRPSALEAAGGAATLDQEGFRWYEDNGSESGSSASAAQDTNITAAAGATKRLRMLVNATGDPATKQFKLQWKKSGGSWADVL